MTGFINFLRKSNIYADFAKYDAEDKSLTYISDRAYLTKINGKSIKYRLAIQLIDCKYSYEVQTSIIPTFEYLTKEQKEKILNSVTENVSFYKNNTEYLIHDILLNNYNIVLTKDIIGYYEEATDLIKLVLATSSSIIEKIRA